MTKTATKRATTWPEAILQTLDRLVTAFLCAYSAGSAIGHIRAGEDLMAGLMIAATLMFASRFVGWHRQHARPLDTT